jgi:hypothetical protein
MDTFIQQIINGLVLGSVYALVALGYTMVYGIINLINFAHGEVLMVGALTSWTVVTELRGTMPDWLLMIVSLLAAIVVCAALNFTIEKVAYRPLRNAPRLAPLITAMGMSLLLQTLAMIVWKPNYKPYPILLPSEPFNIAGAVINTTQILILVVTALTLGGLMYLVNKTKLGRAMRATAENPRVAGLMGVKHHRRRARGAGRRDVRGQLRLGAAHHGLPARAQGVHRGRVRWHRQPARRHARRRDAGPHRIAGGGLHRRAHRRRAGQPLPGHLRLHRADPRAHAAPARPARRARRGSRLTPGASP